MSTVTLVENVRHLVRETFAQLGSEENDSPRETLLIRDGHYCGRRFHSAQYWAVWFMEEDQIKFYGDDHAVLKVVNHVHTQPVAPQKVA